MARWAWRRGWRVALPIALVLQAGCALQRPLVHPRATVAAAQVQTVAPQVRRTWVFPADGVTFDNRIASGRLNAVERLGPYRYVVTIAPERLPINPSPWYGFTVAARVPHVLHIEFDYRHGRQRYRPHLSADGIHWREAGDAMFRKSVDGRYALDVQAGSVPLRVFAQPPVTAADYRGWEAVLADKVALQEEVIGRSVQGRPLRMLRFGNAAAKHVVLVIGRQHPPETTGAMALMKFVDRMAAATPDAERFRSRTLVLVVPLMNPDGVADGNWRGNADGKDINRDWGAFSEPETRAVHDAMSREIDAAGRKLAFAIDFHSTWSDVFYTVKDDPARAPGGLLGRWIGAMQAQFPGRIREVANAAKSTVFKNWVFTRYAAPAVTYEVGDRTSSAQLDQLATFAADRLMQLLDAPAAMEK